MGDLDRRFTGGWVAVEREEAVAAEDGDHRRRDVGQLAEAHPPACVGAGVADDHQAGEQLVGGLLLGGVERRVDLVGAIA